MCRMSSAHFRLSRYWTSAVQALGARTGPTTLRKVAAWFALGTAARSACRLPEVQFSAPPALKNRRPGESQCGAKRPISRRQLRLRSLSGTIFIKQQPSTPTNCSTVDSNPELSSIAAMRSSWIRSLSVPLSVSLSVSLWSQSRSPSIDAAVESNGPRWALKAMS